MEKVIILPGIYSNTMHKCLYIIKCEYKSPVIALHNIWKQQNWSLRTSMNTQTHIRIGGHTYQLLGSRIRSLSIKQLG